MLHWQGALGESSGRAGATPARFVTLAGTFTFAIMRDLFRLRYLRPAGRRGRACLRGFAAKLIEHAATLAERGRSAPGWRLGGWRRATGIDDRSRMAAETGKPR